MNDTITSLLFLRILWLQRYNNLCHCDYQIMNFDYQSLKMIVFYQEKLLFGQPLTWSHTGDGFEIAEEGGLRTEPRLYGNTGNFGIGLTQ